VIVANIILPMKRRGQGGREDGICMSGNDKKYNPPFTPNERIINLVAEISALVRHIVILEDLADTLRLRKENRIKSIQSSLAIENNTLTVEQVTAILNGKRVLAPPNDIREAVNAGAAYELMAALDPYSMDDLLKAHGAMMGGLRLDAGQFRAGEVGVFAGGEVIHMAPPASLVWPHMHSLFEWLRSTDSHPLIASSLFHYEFEFIHPFSDGNGRMGRYWQSLILSHWQSIFAWIPIETVIKERQREYYRALQEAQSCGDDAVFVEYMLSAIWEALKEQFQSVQENVHVSVQENQNVAKLLAVLGNRTLSASEIMQRVGIKSRDGFRRNWLKPALALGVIEQTNPQHPRARNQRYRRVERKK